MTAAFRLVGILGVALLAVRAGIVTKYDVEFRRATRAYEAGDYRTALERFDRVREASDRDPAVWAWIGDSAGALVLNPPAGGWEPGREGQLLERMRSGYVGAVLRNPLDTWSWSGIADAALRAAIRGDALRRMDLRELERWKEGVLDPERAMALGAAWTAVELKPSGYVELDVLADALAAAGQSDQARDVVIRSAKMMPSPALHTWGGPRKKLSRGLYEGILAGMREGLNDAPVFDRSKFRLGIGRFALAQGDSATAIDEMRRAEEAAETTHDRYHALRGEAEALESAGRLEEAVRAWDAAIALDFGPVADRRARGLALARIGRSAEACSDLQEALRDDRGDASLRAKAALTCEEGGDPDTAVRLLREGFVDPTEDPALARGLLELLVRVGKTQTAATLARNWTRDYPDRKDFQEWAARLDAPSF